MTPADSRDAAGRHPAGWPPHEKGENLPGAGRFGVRLFLASLAPAFAALLVGFIVLRVRATEWRPADAPALPPSLWVSTVLIMACSLAAHVACTAVRQDRLRAMRRALWLTLVLAVAFTVCQAIAWQAMVPSATQADAKLYMVTFYLLTGLHALHVLGGIVLQGWVIARAWRGAYWSYHHPGVTYAMMYWHFLDVVWIVTFAALWWGSR